MYEKEKNLLEFIKSELSKLGWCEPRKYMHRIYSYCIQKSNRYPKENKEQGTNEENSKKIVTNIISYIKEKNKYNIDDITSRIVRNDGRLHIRIFAKETERLVNYVLLRDSLYSDVTCLHEKLIKFEDNAIVPYAVYDLLIVFELDYIFKRGHKKKVYDSLIDMGITTFEDMESIISSLYFKYLMSGERISVSDIGKRVHQDEIILTGQDDVIQYVMKCINVYNKIKRKNKPIASFMFIGPTGVGKTSLAKIIANKFFDSMITIIDMSNFSEKHTVSAILGSPPGYVGFKEYESKLIQDMKTRQRRVVLFDEIEKAHPDVMNILLALLDEGRLVTMDGSQLDFSETIVIFTSNALVDTKIINRAIGFYSDNKTDIDIRNLKINALKGHFKPEFLGRIDEIVFFNSLTDDNYREIIRNIARRYGISIDVEMILSKINKSLGARQIEKEVIKQIIEKEVKNDKSMYLE